MKLLHHITAGLVALSLMVGSGWQACGTLQAASSAAAASADTMMMAHHAMDHRGHMQMDITASADAGIMQDDTQPAPQNIDHACMKCCGACMLGGIEAMAPRWTVSLAVSRVVFPLPDEQLRPSLMFVDPHIPKSAA